MKTLKLNNSLKYSSNNDRKHPAKKIKRQIIQEPQQQFSNDASCGVSVVSLTQSLSIGGKEVVRGEWPWY